MRNKHAVDSILSESSLWEYDTIIENAAYRSYFSYKLREPVMVVYKLTPDHYGIRTSIGRPKFGNDIDALVGKIARDRDYHKGYDEGHMANWEDFAWNPSLDSLTCMFYNCIPQTHVLNAGPYEAWEKIIRDESRTDSLLILCGNIYGNNPSRIGSDSVAIPMGCFKVVQSLTPPFPIRHVLLFNNDDLAFWDSAETMGKILYPKEILSYP